MIVTIEGETTTVLVLLIYEEDKVAGGDGCECADSGGDDERFGCDLLGMIGNGSRAALAVRENWEKLFCWEMDMVDGSWTERVVTILRFCGLGG